MFAFPCWIAYSKKAPNENWTHMMVTCLEPYIKALVCYCNSLLRLCSRGGGCLPSIELTHRNPSHERLESSGGRCISGNGVQGCLPRMLSTLTA
jgi:hypothetical protein